MQVKRVINEPMTAPVFLNRGLLAKAEVGGRQNNMVMAKFRAMMTKEYVMI